MPRSGSKPKNPERQRAERAGRRAEALAALYLRLKAYRILEQRFKTPVGEIDLIARRGKTLVFVEVKQRQGAEAEGVALAMVNTKRLVRAAEVYLMRHPECTGLDCRFDVIFLAPKRWPRHLMGAFRAD